MKLNNRFIFGILSLLLAAVIAFVALPTIARQTNGKEEIVRITQPVLKGEQISSENAEVVEVVSTFFCTMLRDVTADGLCITAVQIDSGLHNRKLFRDSQGSQFHAALWVTQTEPQFLIRQFQLQHFLIGLSGYLMAQKFERVKARHLVQFCHCRNCFVHHRHRITFFVHVGNSFLT